MARHAKDIVMFDVPLPLQSKGIEAYKKTWELFFDSNPGGNGSFELTELGILREELYRCGRGFLRPVHLQGRVRW